MIKTEHLKTRAFESISTGEIWSSHERNEGSVSVYDDRFFICHTGLSREDLEKKIKDKPKRKQDEESINADRV